MITAKMATENLAPQIISRLMNEIRDLICNPPEDIIYLDSEDDNNTVSEIYAQISGPVGTPYEGGKFKLKLLLSEDYPTSPPKGYFLTKIYHPNISNTGDICVNTLKKDWTPDVTIKHILKVIRCLLIVPFPESSLNDEAGKMFMDSYEEFAKRARIMTEVHAISEEDKTTTQKMSHHSSSNDLNVDKTTSSSSSSSSSQEKNTSDSIRLADEMKENIILQKKKDIKKKNLKRL